MFLFNSPKEILPPDIKSSRNKSEVQDSQNRLFTSERRFLGAFYLARIDS